MSWRDWWNDWWDMVLDRKPPPPKTHHGPVRDPPHSLPDEVEKKWPPKNERDQ